MRLAAREARWLFAQQHYGENTGQSDTHAIFVELKDPGDGAATGSPRLGPAMPLTTLGRTHARPRRSGVTKDGQPVKRSLTAYDH